MTALIGVVVGDTGYLAIDRMTTLGNSWSTTVKVRPHPTDPLIMFAAAGAPMLTYPAQLIDPPADQQPPDPSWADRYWARLTALASPPLAQDGSLDGNLLVLTPGAVTLIGGTGHPNPVDAHGVALGSGGDFALGAYHGIRASLPDVDPLLALERAITIASTLDNNSGCGVDVLHLSQPADETPGYVPHLGHCTHPTTLRPEGHATT